MEGVLRNILSTLTRPALLFFALPWLMVLLVLGTVAQRYIGLYASQKLFFGSFVLWAGMVPLPGAYSVLALIAASLIAKLLLKSPLGREQAGTILIHVSIVVLLFGGLISALGREEGYIVLADGDSAQSVTDYQLRELSVVKNGKALVSLPYKDMRAGAVFQVPPFALHVIHACFPCTAQARIQKEDALRGVAGKLELVSLPYAKDDAQNVAGVEFAVTGAGAAQDGVYIAYERLASPETISIGKDRFELALKPVQRPLPFSVRLLHFTRSDYPGTDEARSYRSDVSVNDGGLSWNTPIEMNQPLRYKGYTFYQSSFVQDGDRLLTVLAVVKNAGQWFPYIALGLLCLGLLLHICITLRRPSNL